jgi:ATP-dependent RNA helicase DDX19/DBP5
MCAKGKKPDFIKSVFDICAMTQTVIFVNSKDYAERLHGMMRKAAFKSVIIFGKMEAEERDEMISQFRKGEISVIITTNMLARGIDVPEVQIVINFDVPLMKGSDDKICGDAENYLHRIGRTGRFGVKGIAVTIFDREVDQDYLNEILDFYSMREKCKKLESPEQLRDLLNDIRAM